ncbi:phosphopantetheine-binding protein, partial [Streptomyces huiliensis]|uniref:phosphopantetheine-binding protein n=1 Tax=Streptomyces huiliensis TaxID=2876027 RepID=UPI001CBCB3D9
ACGGVTGHGAVVRAASSAAPAAEGSAASGAAGGDRVRVLEETVLAVWRRVLGRERVGSGDNFFDLGGHSLLLVRAQAELNEALGGALTVVDLFAHPNAHSLAGHLAGRRDITAPGDGGDGTGGDEAGGGSDTAGSALGATREQARRRLAARAQRNGKGRKGQQGRQGQEEASHAE